MRKYFALILLSFFSSGVAYCADSSTVKPLGNQVVPQQLKAYVNTNDCQKTAYKYWFEAGRVGGGDTGQSCPSHHPVLYAHHQMSAFFVAGSTGNTSAVCCAIGYVWEDAPKA